MNIKPTAFAEPYRPEGALGGDEKLLWEDEESYELISALRPSNRLTYIHMRIDRGSWGGTRFFRSTTTRKMLFICFCTCFVYLPCFLLFHPFTSRSSLPYDLLSLSLFLQHNNNNKFYLQKIVFSALLLFCFALQISRKIGSIYLDFFLDDGSR